MGVLLGLCFGAGALLVFSALTVPSHPRGGRGHPTRLRSLLDSAGLHGVGVGALLGLCAFLAVATTVGMQVASRTLPVALLFGLMAGYLPVAVVRGRALRRRRELAAVWPEVVDDLASAVRAGLSLPEALSALSQRGPEALRAPFAAFAVDYQAGGRFGDSLDRLKARLADPVGDRVVEALRVAREVGGGDLGRLLRSLSTYLREDARTRAELESRQAWTVNGARLAVAAPWLVLLLLCFQPHVIHRYASTAGALVLGAGALACVVAYRLMVRLGRLPVERRILQ